MTISERIDKTLARSGLRDRNIAVRVRASILQEIIQIVDEAVECVKLVDLVVLNETFKFGSKRLSEFMADTNSLQSYDLDQYGLDTIFALKNRLQQNGIEYEIQSTKPADQRK